MTTAVSLPLFLNTNQSINDNFFRSRTKSKKRKDTKIVLGIFRGFRLFRDKQNTKSFNDNVNDNFLFKH